VNRLKLLTKFPALQEKRNNLIKGGLALRKYLALALGLLFILSFTATAFAIHIPELPPDEQIVTAKGAEITLGGRILVRGWYFDNTDFNLPVKTPSRAQYTTNAYLFLDAKITDNLQAFMELETCNNRDGTSGLYTWGTLDQKPVADLFFRQLWIQYTGSGLLGAPAGIKIGHQLLTLGEKQFLNHERFGDDAIVLFVNPTKELHLAGVTLKLSDGNAADNTDDIDAYVILGTYKLGKDNTIGANYTYVNMSDADLKFSNFGLHANGVIANALSYAAEFDYQFGEIGDPGLDFGGWGFMAKAGYKLDPVNLRASFAYGSGDDDSDDDNIDEFQTTVGNNGQSPLARFVHYTQIYERTVRTSAMDQNLGSGTARTTGIANTIYYNLGLDIMPLKDISLSLDGFIIQATETPSDVDDDVGTELDFKASWKLAKNLTYFVEAAAFWSGDFYEDSNPGIDAKTVTQVVHGINLTF
jgi:hypothetical protein